MAGHFLLQKVLAGVMVAALAFGAAPVSTVRAADGVPIDEAHFPDEAFSSLVRRFWRGILVFSICFGTRIGNPAMTRDTCFLLHNL